ncbi:MAG TPA: hypothetical protein VKB67_13850 [Rhizomicrobium sp.]|nr:hypothetical protein [Rhizomicrobium sp.]
MTGFRLAQFGVLAAMLLAPTITHAAANSSAPKVGDTYELILTKDTIQQGSQGSSGNSHDKDTIIERVTGIRTDGIEVEYDLPDTATAKERASNWQLPARIFRPFAGPVQLLNGAELNDRVNKWLKATGLSRSACGQWIFTWNAFQIECDPQSVIKTVEAFDLRNPSLSEGATYQDTDANGPVTLTKASSGQDGAILVAEMQLNPDTVRRARAESDVVVGQIMKRPISLDAAVAKHAADTISGTISVRFETDTSGNARRRTKVTKLNIKTPDGQSETQTTTETLEWRLISQRN